MIAVSCGTPTPATIRVVQIEPGPMPTLIASAPASTSALAASAVATLPATTWTEFDRPLHPLDRRGDVDVVAVRGVDDDAVAAGVDQRLRALEAGVADGGRRGDPQPPFGILGRERRGDRLLDVLDGDQADAMVVLVDHQQFLDPPLVEDAPRLVLAGAERRRSRDCRWVISSLTGWRGFSAKRTSRLVRMPHSLPDFSTIGMPLMRLAFISSSASARVWSGVMVIGLTTIPLSKRLTCADRGRLLLDVEVAVEHADPAELRQRDRHVGLGHRVHRRGQDRDVERDLAGQAGPGVGLARQHARFERLQQDVVERQAERNVSGVVELGHIGP